MDCEKPEKPHAVCVPFPSQGHVNPMMYVAKVLHAKGFHITFVNNEFNHRRLKESTDGDSAGLGCDDFTFEAITDGLPPLKIDATQSIPKLCNSTREHCLVPFRQLLHKLNNSLVCPPVTCIISDGSMNFTQQAADELQIPRVFFFTTSACSFWAYLHYPKLVQRGYTPLKDESCLTNGYLDQPLDLIKGMQNIRLKDLPSFIRTTDPNDIMLNYISEELQFASKASAVILNTFEELEGVVLDAIRSVILPVYTVGPLNKLFRINPHPAQLDSIGSSLWKEETECLKWLDKQMPKSVMYVNFGSITVINGDQLIDFAWGLANSNHPFLWIIRPDLVEGEAAMLPKAFIELTKGRAFLASWCPQEQVLSHPSVAGFLTHSGWNSTLESICAGVPMICWPFFAEQPTNCRYACNEWGIGMEIDNNVKREEVEYLVRELMEGEMGMKIRAKAMKLKEKAEGAVRPGGSSYESVNRLVMEVLARPSMQPLPLSTLGAAS